MNWCRFYSPERALVVAVLCSNGFREEVRVTLVGPLLAAQTPLHSSVFDVCPAGGRR